MDDFRRHKEQLMQNPEFQKEYEALQPEFSVIRALVNARLEQNLSQAQLAQRTGIRQSNISRIETGACSPTIATLQALARGMGKTLEITFK